MTRLKRVDSGLDHKDWLLLKSLNSPRKIQDYLNAIPFNKERGGETHHSVKKVLKASKAHCFEGALLAAAALWIQGKKPLILDLKVVRPDFDHVVTLFQVDEHWGAISKTNHAVLRYRDPIYKSIRELAMTYFHEYFLGDGQKTLRSYSKPYDLSRVGTVWISGDENLAWLAHQLDASPHENILTPKQIKMLRNAEKIEVNASSLTEYP